MGQELKGDATLAMMANIARFRRILGMDPRYDNPEALQSWMNFVKGHPGAVKDGETAKVEEGAARDGLGLET